MNFEFIEHITREQWYGIACVFSFLVGWMYGRRGNVKRPMYKISKSIDKLVKHEMEQQKYLVDLLENKDV